MKIHIMVYLLALVLSISTAFAQNVTRLECEENIFNGRETPSYAATLTVEGGVRVFRALPTHRKIIVPCDRIKPAVDISIGDGGIAIKQYQHQK